MDPKSDAPLTVDSYIDRFPEEVQAKLKQMREIIKAAAPEATERIAYQMPAYEWNGPVVYFGGFKSHIGFFPTGEELVGLDAELAHYKRSKGTIQFSLSEPIPVELVEKIVRFRLESNQKKMESKKAARKAKPG
jgi:uncharacterized protein YdhG (YjbR/CyaY superfamily)